MSLKLHLAMNVLENQCTGYAADRKRLVAELVGPNCNLKDPRVLAAMN